MTGNYRGAREGCVCELGQVANSSSIVVPVKLRHSVRKWMSMDVEKLRNEGIYRVVLEGENK